MRRICTSVALAVVIVTLLFAVRNVSAGYISVREDLESLLAENAVVEDFEGLTSPYSVRFFETLDADTIISGKGPNLVEDGIVIDSGSSSDYWLQWNNASATAQPTKDICGNDSLIIDFTQSVWAVGLDVTVLAGYARSGIVSVFALDDSQEIYSRPIELNNETEFFGYSNGSGIGSVRIEGTDLYSPSLSVDNLTFNGPVPIPGAVWLLGSGLIAVVGLRRRLKR